jgi:hypothetical protein
VKELQERGLTLEEVRREVEPGRRKDTAREPRPPSRSLWTRIELIPGVELHLSRGSLAPSKLDELAAWCRLHIRQNRENDDA